MSEKIAFVTSVSVGFSAGLKHFAQPRPRDLLGFNIASAGRRPQHSAGNVTKISHEGAISYLGSSGFLVSGTYCQIREEKD